MSKSINIQNKKITNDSIKELANRGRLRLLGHGSIILVLGLLAGFPFLFFILDAVIVWPFTFSDSNFIPGSEHGWRLAHIAVMMNGMVIILAGLMVPHIQASKRALTWIVWGLVYTGWGNFIFFHFANLSNNRGASAGYTEKFGLPDMYGKIGYIIGASTIPFTIISFTVAAVCAFAALRANRKQGAN